MAINKEAWERAVCTPISPDGMDQLRSYMHEAVTVEVKHLLARDVSFNWLDGSRPDGSKFSMHAICRNVLLDAAHTSGASLAADVGLRLWLKSCRYMVNSNMQGMNPDRQMHLRILQLHKLQGARAQPFIAASVVDTVPYMIKQQFRCA